jgi:hypothetical protein
MDEGEMEFQRWRKREFLVGKSDHSRRLKEYEGKNVKNRERNRSSGKENKILSSPIDRTLEKKKKTTGKGDTMTVTSEMKIEWEEK